MFAKIKIHDMKSLRIYLLIKLMSIWNSPVIGNSIHAKKLDLNLQLLNCLSIKLDSLVGNLHHKEAKALLVEYKKAIENIKTNPN